MTEVLSGAAGPPVGQHGHPGAEELPELPTLTSIDFYLRPTANVVKGFESSGTSVLETQI